VCVCVCVYARHERPAAAAGGGTPGGAREPELLHNVHAQQVRTLRHGPLFTWERARLTGGDSGQYVSSLDLRSHDMPQLAENVREVRGLRRLQ
jgi:hypothetical protein